MKLIYDTDITYVGDNASGFLEKEMFILFKSNAPEGLAEYCYIHDKNDLEEDIRTGDVLYIDDTQYKITSVGNVVNKNLDQLGHITLKFDGNSKGEVAGTLYLERKKIVPPRKGTKIKIIRN